MKIKILSISLLILVAMMAVAGAEATVIWDGEVDLNEGTFDYIPAESPSESYEWNRLTGLGALQTASNAGGFDFNTNDINTELGSFYINSINGIANEGDYSWSILINNEAVDKGLGLNELEDGDKVTFYYLKWIEETPGEWVPDVESATHSVNIQVNVATVIWDGEVDLNGGTFNYTPAENPSESYKWESLTDLGALQTASNADGFDFNTSDINAELGSFYINSINEIANEGDYSWSILINNEAADKGLGLNELEDGDKVTFYYLKWIEETPGEWVPDVGNATHSVNIQVNDATVIWDGEVELDEGTFDYIPAENPSESYEWNSLTDLGALQTASNAGGFDFNTSDVNTEFGSFYINSINGITNEDPGGYSWSILINDEAAEKGLGLNELEDGDTVAFYYLQWFMDDAGGYEADVENASYKVNIDVSVTEDESQSGSSSSSSSKRSSSSGGTGEASVVETVEEDETNSSEEADTKYSVPDEENEEEPESVETTNTSIESDVDAETTPGFGVVFAVATFLLSAIFLAKRRM